VGNFKLLFSFDYRAQGPWSRDAVTELLRKYTRHPAYFKHDGKRPFVSTFEGAECAEDWPAIKAATNAFFVPDWSSVSAAHAVRLAGGVVDGLFSFKAWPSGRENMTTDMDDAFRAALGARRVYMMPVSPWFYTNLPGFGGKNWMWRGDGLWDRRWRQVIKIQPDFVQILTWNDFGESHYIGPIPEKALGLFQVANAPINYAQGVTHDGWRKFLPYYIEVYKTGKAPQQVDENVYAYYRTTPAYACPNGGTSGGSAAHGESVMPPEHLVDDNVFFSTLLNTDRGVTITVRIGDNEQTGVFTEFPAAGRGTPGVYMGSVPFAGRTGDVVVAMLRGSKVISRIGGGKPIANICENGTQNWNAVAI